MLQLLGFKGTRCLDKDEENPMEISLAGSPTPRALELLYCDENRKLRLNKETLEFLRTIEGPVGVVSMCGPPRQGKSFLLNQLLGQSHGFEVGPTHRPCTKGIWIWSVPTKRVSLDGTEYNVLFLDCEGIDAYDQTGTYSIQIFSLAILLSSIFIYNQMGGIDEATLDRLSLVTEMTKHIKLRASRKSSLDELGQVSPVLLWLLRDFYLELNEDGRTITPDEYLQSALYPVLGAGDTKNQVRDAIRSLFPDRHCFTLVRPLDDEHELQQLNQVPFYNLRQEFRSGLKNLATFIYGRVKPKQVESTVMTGPVFAELTESFVDALNAGAVPTITTSWQNLEEKECRRAYDLALDTYQRTFENTQVQDMDALYEAHDVAVEAAMHAYDAGALGIGPARNKHDKLLKAELRSNFKAYKQKAQVEQEHNCLQILGDMEIKVRQASHNDIGDYDHIWDEIKLLLLQYMQSCFAPSKWRELMDFLIKSLDGPIRDAVYRANEKTTAICAEHKLKYDCLEESTNICVQQKTAAEKETFEWKKRYELVMSDFKSVSERSITSQSMLEVNISRLEQQRAELLKQLEEAQSSLVEWKGRYTKAMDQQLQGGVTKTLCTHHDRLQLCPAEAMLASAREQLQLAKDEASELRRKHDAIASDYDSAVQRANALLEHVNQRSQQREDELRADLSSRLAEKVGEVADLQSRLEMTMHRVAELESNLKIQQSESACQAAQLAALQKNQETIHKAAESVHASAKAVKEEMEDTQKLKFHNEAQLRIIMTKLEAAEARCASLEDALRDATNEATKSKQAAALSEKLKFEEMNLSMERLAALEKAETLVEALQKQRDDMWHLLEKTRNQQHQALLKAETLEESLEMRQQGMEEILMSEHAQRTDSVKVLETLLASERTAHAEANARAELLSLQLQSVQAKLDKAQQDLALTRFGDTTIKKLRDQGIDTRKRWSLEKNSEKDRFETMEHDNVRTYKRRSNAEPQSSSPLRVDNVMVETANVH